MAKQVNMLNIQSLIILIVLLATALVNSMDQTGTSSGIPYKITSNDIRTFENYLEDYRNITGGTEDDINHFNSWRYWKQTYFRFQKNCVLRYLEEMSNAGRVNYSDPVVLGQLAYKSLHKEIKQDVTNYLGLLANNAELKDKMESIYKRGEYLKFAAHWRTATDFSVKSKMRQLMDSDRHMTPDKAHLLVNLLEYPTQNRTEHFHQSQIDVLK